MLEVIQADRDAAKPFFNEGGPAYPQLVQAFARHRLTSLPAQPEPAKPADLCAESAHNSTEVGKLIERLRGACDRTGKPSGVHMIDGQRMIARVMAESLEDEDAQMIAQVADCMAHCIENEALLFECLKTEALQAADTLARLEAERRELVEALEPFAKAAMGVEVFDPGFPMDGAALRASFDWYDKAQGEPLKRHSVRRADLERARAALAHTGGEG
jgi:hypothetical protein